MTARLFFLVPDEEAAVEVVKELKKHDVSEDNIYAVAKKSHYPLDERVPDAGILERSDFVNAAKRGAAIGSTAGLLAGLTAVVLNPLGLVAAGGALVASALGGATMGTWTSTLIGVSVTNTDFDEFQGAIDDGKILMLVDAERELSAKLQRSLEATFPNLIIQSGEIQN